MHFLYVGMLAEKFGDPEGGFILTFHADGERFDAAQQQEGRMRVNASTEGGTCLMNLFDQIAASYGDAAHDVGVAAKIFCSRVQY